VVSATLVGGLAAWAVVRIAGRTRRPPATFTALVVVGFAASGAAPVAASTTAATAGWLLLLHVVVAVPLVAVGRRLIRTPA
jgi:peptidoglycan/LPS O-acetylase OafA/YrhL